MVRLRSLLRLPVVAGLLVFVMGYTELWETGPLATGGAATSSGWRSEKKAPPVSPELLALGKRVYEKQCVACHGANGRGNGEAAYLLYPKPRDFVRARYRLVSTWEGVPTDEDLFGSISRGMPGSVMPSWGYLPERTRWGLVYYVKSFAKKPLVVKSGSDPTPDGDSGTGIIRVPPEPPFTPQARARALELYAEACASCHGKTGKGDGVEKQLDEKGYPTRPRDLTVGVFKGNPEPASLYRRIVAGMPGSPMPMSDWAYGKDAWHLAHLIRSWSSDEQRARAEMRKFTIVSRRVQRVPEHPD
ncbi:MAG: c-type cytochrome, partial [Dehalococcoidia bacterium]